MQKRNKTAPPQLQSSNNAGQFARTVKGAPSSDTLATAQPDSPEALAAQGWDVRVGEALDDFEVAPVAVPVRGVYSDPYPGLNPDMLVVCTLCPKCGGTGKIEHLEHVQDGLCFHCDAEPDYRYRRTVKQLRDRAKRQAAKERKEDAERANAEASLATRVQEALSAYDENELALISKGRQARDAKIAAHQALLDEAFERGLARYDGDRHRAAEYSYDWVYANTPEERRDFTFDMIERIEQGQKLTPRQSEAMLSSLRNRFEAIPVDEGTYELKAKVVSTYEQEAYNGYGSPTQKMKLVDEQGRFFHVTVPARHHNKIVEQADDIARDFKARAHAAGWEHTAIMDALAEVGLGEDRSAIKVEGLVFEFTASFERSRNHVSTGFGKGVKQVSSDGFARLDGVREQLGARLAGD